MATKEQAVYFRNTIIQPALISIGLWSEAAGELLLGTALKESGLVHRAQIGGGPALGLFQMEPATHDDIWDNYLKYHQNLGNLITSLKTTPSSNSLSELKLNDRYAAGMARIHYRRSPTALPASGNLQSMAGYWKRYYNTPLGLGTVQQYVNVWHNVMG